jgi:hypothetical protein
MIEHKRYTIADKGNDSFSRFSIASIASISNEVVVARAAKLGVLLGVSPSQVTSW